VQGCWYSANVTVSGTIPTYGSDHRPYSHWSHSTAMARRSLSIIKAAISLQDRLKNKSIRVTECHVVFGENRLKCERRDWKKEQESSWGCVVEMFKTPPAGAFYPRLMEYVLLNRSDEQSQLSQDCLSIYWMVISTKKMFTLSKSLHSMPPSHELYIPVYEISCSKFQKHAR